MKTLITAVLIVASAAVAAAPRSELTRHFSAYNKKSTAAIDHSAFAAFLSQYLAVRDHAPNLVRYAKVKPTDHKRLQAYIETLSQVALGKYNRHVQLAYWINLYNAALVDLVLDHYPVASVNDIGGIMASAWEIPVVTIDGYRLTLNDIRHYILQPIWDDSLINYALSWAAIGGPELRAKPYTGDQIYLQLHNSAERFVNSPQGVRIKDHRLIISSFFDWFRDEFGGSTAALISQLRQHAEPALSARLDLFDRIDRFVFDWRLNAAGAGK